MFEVNICREKTKYVCPVNINGVVKTKPAPINDTDVIFCVRHTYNVNSDFIDHSIVAKQFMCEDINVGDCVFVFGYIRDSQRYDPNIYCEDIFKPSEV